MFNDYMVSPVFFLVAIRHVDDVFVDDGESQCILLAICDNGETLEQLRKQLANALGHGDRLVIFSSDPVQRSSMADVMVIVDNEAN